ncbi:MAG: DUF3089 domain-containing protein [Pseudopedobacter saltans]|uniref:DUF3089 domain-containing protein n=1 Tax=Pseudopedobacter saltans TaxID=151895 RepID=A0A2W5H1B1_9SPHI|nr:MAG: DUF3089 domain-containing protein [Pseudopedobacter saltans]
MSLSRLYIITIIFCTTLTSLASFAQESKPGLRYLMQKLAKEATPNTGPAPDYSNLYYWAASPFKKDPSDSVPSFLKDEVRTEEADVFFIHPTSYKSIDGNSYSLADLQTKPLKMMQAMKDAPWNADLSDTSLNNETDSKSILYQASVFNGSCRVFAPRYRQANLKAFLVRNADNEQKAFDLAYEDIKTAFQYFLDHYNKNRPIIIAGHSQGCMLATRLLKDFFDGKSLQNRLVCAYLIGSQIPKNSFQHIPIGENPYQTGCFVGWRSFREGSALPPMILEETGGNQCVNPLKWTTDTVAANPSDNKGSMLLFGKIIPGKIGAKIDPQNRILWVDGDLGKYLPSKMTNLHILDYNLFWLNIRENVKTRVGAFFKR